MQPDWLMKSCSRPIPFCGEAYAEPEALSPERASTHNDTKCVVLCVVMCGVVGAKKGMGREASYLPTDTPQPDLLLYIKVKTTIKVVEFSYFAYTNKYV